MPAFEIIALEKFTVRTHYRVRAGDAAAAEAAVRDGRVAYDDKEIVDGGEEYVATVSVAEIEAAPDDPTIADADDGGEDDG